VLHRRWAGLSEAQRTQFTQVFRELVVLTYVNNFSSYDGEKFTTVSTQDMNGDYKTVHALLKPVHGDPVHFDYVLHGSDSQGWRIVNIVADGVSDLAVRSSQYEQKFQQSGFDGLVKALQEQIEKARKECA
jgi:phospholipid transport system substrate-binding protein